MNNGIEPTSELCIFRKETFYLPVNCWICVDQETSPVIKIQQDYEEEVNYNNFCSVTISDNPKLLNDNITISKDDMDKILTFIKSVNIELLGIWNNELGRKRALDSIKNK